jgi:hypothetical protein
MATARYTASFINLQKRATRALARFCDEHQCSHPALQRVKECLSALEAGDTERAWREFEAVPLGGAGHLSDWRPRPTLPSEEAQHLGAVFDALVHYWSYSMNLMKARR